MEASRIYQDSRFQKSNIFFENELQASSHKAEPSVKSVKSNLSSSSVYTTKNYCQNCVNKDLMDEKARRERNEKDFDKNQKSSNETAHRDYLRDLKQKRQFAFESQRENHEILENQIKEKQDRKQNEKALSKSYIAVPSLY